MTPADILNRLKAKAGRYEGEGINHEQQSFRGQLTLTEIVTGRGLSLDFKATGKSGLVFHQEHSVIALTDTGKLALWNLNSNCPGLLRHDFLECESRANGFVLIFQHGDITDTGAFRERLTLTIEESAISYGYAWGMPGGEFSERSTVRMLRL